MPMTLPNPSPPSVGGDVPGPCNPHANPNLRSQVMGWGASADFSYIIDQGSAHEYMVKFVSKGESHSEKEQLVLTRLAAAVADRNRDRDDCSTLPDTLMKCTKHRDMDAQEAIHLLRQTPKGCDRRRVFVGGTRSVRPSRYGVDGDCGLAAVRDLLSADVHRLETHAWDSPARDRPVDELLVAMPYSDRHQAQTRRPENFHGSPPGKPRRLLQAVFPRYSRLTRIS